MLLPIWYKKILFCFSCLLEIFGLFLPYANQSATCNQRYVILKQCYTIFLSLLILSGYAYLQWFETQIINKTTRTSNVILIRLVNIAVTLICITTITGKTFWNEGNWSQFMKLQNIVTRKMEIDTFWRNKFYFVLEIILGHIFFIFVAAVDQYRQVVFKLHY